MATQTVGACTWEWHNGRPSRALRGELLLAPRRTRARAFEQPANGGAQLVILDRQFRKRFRQGAELFGSGAVAIDQDQPATMDPAQAAAFSVQTRITDIQAQTPSQGEQLTNGRFELHASSVGLGRRKYTLRRQISKSSRRKRTCGAHFTSGGRRLSHWQVPIFSVGQTRLELLQGDITQSDTEAIANAANAMLLAGGGVDGAIHRAAGPELQRALRAKKLELPGGLLATGQAVITEAFGLLRARYVIHCVGPIYDRERERAPELLRSCYERALELCVARRIGSITFPSISTGAYGYPLHEAAGVAMDAIGHALNAAPLPGPCRFVLYDERTLGSYVDAAAARFAAAESA